ncbi:DUF3093 domain-containing protein [Galbitalea soli]|uniref:DUF3093 domain-containing protein n=1 Tax=Galbitalea soli TaxID=1268042 RepID=A0A7C9PLN0_9MICO|nr:DUF3093 domain-containing protein [Galbitalea soli]NEM90266.1 DUF3093 domain-containing protein [Galbitalea soli]NYJ30974.1 hypothetical protein [Galbitalea soli]
MSIYRERLLPGPWVFIMILLLIPASLLVFLPINQTAGVVVAAVLYLGAAGFLVLASPSIAITADEFVAGRARLPLTNVGEVTAYRGAAATKERGPQLDARAWLVIRGWIKPVVKVVVKDESDPTPYWLISTRDPEAIVRAVEAARTRA